MQHHVARYTAALLAAFLVACGGGGGSTSSAPPVQPTTPAPTTPPLVEKPSTRAEAARFLTQATFGPTDADIDRLMSVGYAAWVDEQLALQPSSHRARWEAQDAANKATGGNGVGQTEVLNVFWEHAVTAPDQLRQRWAFALSQIFVLSMVDGTVAEQPRGVAAWMDLLADKGLGSYRVLLEEVSRNPLMGAYLSHLRNQKADSRTGRLPDENYAREVLQLFSIGVVKLDEAGRPGTDSTYSAADVSGLAKVFTGWSWACPEWPADGCFSRGAANGLSDPDRAIKPMLGYPQYHSAEEKRFLGTVVAAQSLSDPGASLKAALDRLAAHDNVGPFLGRQLIQRLVTSNPTDAHVTAVSRAFADNGSGQRGDMKAVLKAVLLHADARASSNQVGKLREPVLRLTAFMRAFPHSSETGGWRIGNTDNPASSLGQAPLRSPTVFNFFRPGYVAPGTQAAAAKLLTPEMQLVHETSIAGYVNYLRDAVASGLGSNAPSGKRDVQANLSAELALADKPAELVERVTARLMAGSVPAALKTDIGAAVSSIAIPALAANGSNQAAVDSAKRNRVNTALLLTLVSPEFLVQK